jgi:hypothetical protein
MSESGAQPPTPDSAVKLTILTFRFITIVLRVRRRGQQWLESLKLAGRSPPPLENIPLVWILD